MSDPGTERREGTKRDSRRRYTTLGLVIGAAVALAASVAPAHAEPRHEARGANERHRDIRRSSDRHSNDQHRDIGRFRVVERHRNVDWRFDRGRGWRFHARPGVWSPYYSWWAVNRQVVMLAAPTVTVVNYPTGRYLLRGDGVTVPYYWQWMPARTVFAAPPPPPYGAASPDAPYPAPAPPPPPPLG